MSLFRSVLYSRMRDTGDNCGQGPAGRRVPRGHVLCADVLKLRDAPTHAGVRRGEGGPSGPGQRLLHPQQRPLPQPGHGERSTL